MAKVPNHTIIQFKELLFRIIDNEQLSNDENNYENLRIKFIQDLDALDIPDFLFSIENITDFKAFISAISVTNYGKKRYLEEIFNDLINKKNNTSTISSIVDKRIIEAKQTSKIYSEQQQGKSSIIIKYSWAFISVIATLATIYGVYLQIKSSAPRIEVNNSLVSHLTIPPRIAGLRAEYYYRDSSISDLWKLNIIVKNIGEETILSIGPKKNIISADGLDINVINNYKILNINKSSGTLPISIQAKNDTTIKLIFSQWRKGEEVNIELYLENMKNDKIKTLTPIAKMNERQIIDGKVDNILYQQNIQKNKNYLIDYLPKYFANPIKWSIITIFIFIGFIILPITIFSEIKSKKSKSEKIGVFIGLVLLTLIFIMPLLWIIPKFW